MKERILKILFVFMLMVSILMCLTACGDEDSSSSSKNSKKGKNESKVDYIEDDESSIKNTIQYFVDAINDQDTERAVDLLDIDEMEEILNEDINKKDLKNGFDEFFDEEENFSIKVSDIDVIDDPEEVLKKVFFSANESISIDSAIDSKRTEKKETKNELTSEQKKELEKYVFVSAKIKLSGEYGEKWEEGQDEIYEMIDEPSLKGKDIIIMTNEDGEYKIVYSLTLLMLESASVSVNTNQLSEMENNVFNQQFLNYEGKQVGSSVVVLISTVISNYSSNNSFQEKIPAIEFIDQKSETITIESDSKNYIKEVEEIKVKIATSHYYNVEMEYSNNGIIDKIIISY